MCTALIDVQAVSTEQRGAGSGSNAPRRGMSSALRSSLRKRTKHDLCETFLARLREGREVDVDEAGFQEGVREHFQLLPTRYALDVNLASLDVLNHKQLLQEARQNPDSVAFQVRQVEVLLPRAAGAGLHDSLSSSPVAEEHMIPAPHARRGNSPGLGILRPAFASSPNLASLLEGTEQDSLSEDGTEGDLESKLFFEITVGARDQPKLLSMLSRALADVGLNIREAHVFNTHDKYSLDVFVTDGWINEGKEGLEDTLKQHFSRLLVQPEAEDTDEQMRSSLEIPQPSTAEDVDLTRDRAGPLEDWEIDVSRLKLTCQIAAGSFGNLYKGIYFGQEVAVKIIKDAQKNMKQFQEFMQEVSIMRKVRHKNVVQLIGACTTKPNLCIVVEFMAGGSVSDCLKKNGPYSLAECMKISLDVARGMDYLHQRNIIHRDLKSANLMLDEKNNVKIGDFGVARVIAPGGDMTAETGTYRWMAPEIIGHQKYNAKADVFSYGVLLSELLTGNMPYKSMDPMQAVMGVMQNNLRPIIPPTCPSELADLIRSCWDIRPPMRPTFCEIIQKLEDMCDSEPASSTTSPRPKSGLLSRLRGKGGVQPNTQ